MTLLAVRLALLFSLSADVGGPSLAPIYATPQTIVERMLQVGQLQAGEKLCDLGSGDGRIVITAAQQFHASATGIELDDTLYRESNARIHQLGLTRAARIVHGDLQKQHYSSYDIVTVFLNSESNEVIEPLLERELNKGARVVSHYYGFKGWRPEKIETIDDDGAGQSHTIYLYRR